MNNMMRYKQREKARRAMSQANPSAGVSMKVMQPQEAEPTRPGWGDALAMVGGALMDADGTMGSGNMQGAMTRTQQRIRLKDAERQAQLDEQRRQAIMSGMGLSPDQQALMTLDPEAATKALIAQSMPSYGDQTSRMTAEHSIQADERDFDYRVGRDEVMDERDERDFGFKVNEAERDQLNKDRNYQAGRDDEQFDRMDANRSFGQRQNELAIKLEEARQEGAGIDAQGERDLRKEFTALTQDFQKVQGSYGRIQASAQDPSAAGDLALIFNYMKMLDPGSVVRESEFATAQNAAGVDERIRNIYNRVLTGERLADEQRGDFVSRADQLYSQAEGAHATLENRYRGIASDYGYDPQRAIPDLRAGITRADPPSGAIEMLRQDPSLATAFDEKYGRGAAQRVLGGSR